MRWLRGFFFAGLFACVAPSPLALAQASAGDSISGTAAPSDNTIQPGSAAPKKSSLKPAHSGAANKVGSTLASGAINGETPALCFQPGIGWQRAPQVAFRSAARTGVKSATGGSGIAGVRPLGKSQRISDECPSSPAIEASMSGKPNTLTNAAKRTPNMNLGAEDWLKVNSAPNPASSFAFSRLKMGLGPIPYPAASFSQHDGSGDSLHAAQELGSHAYISTIRLRKMMRSAPDLETRLELQKIGAKVAGEHDKHLDSYTKSKAREENLEQDLEGIPASSSMTGGKVNHSRTAP